MGIAEANEMAKYTMKYIRDKINQKYISSYKIYDTDGMCEICDETTLIINNSILLIEIKTPKKCSLVGCVNSVAPGKNNFCSKQCLFEGMGL